MQRRTLIVDDEAAVCDFIQDVLTSIGIRVLALTKTAEALVHLRDEKFAMVLIDSGLPAPDGISLIRRIRESELNRSTLVIMVSDDQSPSAVSRGFAAGANFFLYKPMNEGSLLNLIRTVQGATAGERRRFRRVSVQSKVQIQCEQGEWEGETIDVSPSGVLVEAYRGPTPSLGARVKVHLQLSPAEESIVGSGSVVRIFAGNRFGIRFNQLPVAESERLQDFLLPLIVEALADGNGNKTPKFVMAPER